MSEFIYDTGQTTDKPLDYSWRLNDGGGCLGTIDCEKCGCIMGARGSHCFCMGIYTCPRCGYVKKSYTPKNLIKYEDLLDDEQKIKWNQTLEDEQTWEEYYNGEGI